MKLRKGKTWYKVLKRFGNKVLVERPSTILRESATSWKQMSDFDEAR